MEIIRILITGLIICLSSWIVGLLGSYWRTKIYDKNLKVLKPPFLIFWIGFVDFLGCIITIIVIFFAAFNEENLVWAIGFFLFSFLGLWLMLYALNWKIVIKDESFVFRNMFGKKREIKYSDITELKRIKIGGYRIYVGKKSIAVDYFIKGADNLWDKLKVLKIK
ncbi:MAG: DUF6560 family protein [Candidatus Coproplasma sp.]